jgi:hypothetical protein
MIKIDGVSFNEQRLSWHWTSVKLGPRSIRKHLLKGQVPHEVLPIIRDWCDTNGSSRYYNFISIFYFEDTKDATLFALRWV